MNDWLRIKLSIKRAAVMLTVLFALVSFFHLFVLFGLVPDTIVWGGQVKTREELVVMEILSLTINLILVFFSLRVYQSVPGRGIRTFFLVFAVIFILNTVGNLFAVSVWERVLFTPLTLLSAILCYRISIGD